MSPTATAILTALLALPPYHRDAEVMAERERRLSTVAVAIDQVVARYTCGDTTEPCRPAWPGTRPQLAAMLVTQGFFESGFAQHLHEGVCGPHECDGGRAHGLWQVHAGGPVPFEAWQEMSGTSARSTWTSAFYAASLLSKSMKACGTLAGAVSMYATGKTCEWAGAAPRIAFMRKLSLWP